MRTFKRGTAATLLLLSPLVQAEGLEDQLNAFFAQKLAGFSDDVRVTVRTPPNLYPSCEAPSFSVTGSTKLWGNVNVLARCANEKRYLQVAVQATGNYVVAAVPIPRGSLLQPDSVTLKRGRLDQLPPRTMLDINQLRRRSACAMSPPTGDTAIHAAPGMAGESGTTGDGGRQWRRL